MTLPSSMIMESEIFRQQKKIMILKKRDFKKVIKFYIHHNKI